MNSSSSLTIKSCKDGQTSLIFLFLNSSTVTPHPQLPILSQVRFFPNTSLLCSVLESGRHRLLLLLPSYGQMPSSPSHGTPAPFSLPTVNLCPDPHPLALLWQPPN